MPYGRGGVSCGRGSAVPSCLNITMRAAPQMETSCIHTTRYTCLISNSNSKLEKGNEFMLLFLRLPLNVHTNLEKNT